MQITLKPYGRLSEHLRSCVNVQIERTITVQTGKPQQLWEQLNQSVIEIMTSCSISQQEYSVSMFVGNTKLSVSNAASLINENDIVLYELSPWTELKSNETMRMDDTQRRELIDQLYNQKLLAYYLLKMTSM